MYQTLKLMLAVDLLDFLILLYGSKYIITCSLMVKPMDQIHLLMTLRWISIQPGFQAQTPYLFFLLLPLNDTSYNRYLLAVP